MTVSMYPGEVLKRVYPATFRDEDGTVLSSVTVRAVMLPLRTVPGAAATGTDVDYTHFAQPDPDGFSGEVAILVAGPDTAAVSEAFTLYEWGADLYWRPDENPEVDWQFIERYEILR